MSATDSAVPVSLNHHKQEAEQLLTSFVSGDPSAIDRVASARPKLAEKDPFILADAQSVVAREQGYDSWRKLKDDLESDVGATGILHRLNSNHARGIAEHLSNRLNAEVACSLQSVQESTYGAYLETLSPNIALYTYHLEPLGGHATLDYTTHLAYGIIYGAGGLAGDRPDRPAYLTPEERKAITPTVRKTLAELELAWGPELKLHVSNASIKFTVEDARIVENDAPVSVATMEVTGAVSGRIRVCYPLSVIELALTPETAKDLSRTRTQEILETRRVINVVLPVGIKPIRGMSYIPEGPFLMGDQNRDSFREEPARKVTLDAYWIDTYPVTNADYRTFVEETGHDIPPHWTSGRYQLDQSDHPVTNVNWHDAQAYAKWAGKRLPTESEWEKAARGTDGQSYPWGESFWKDLCNGCDDYGGTTSVERFSGGSSPYGIVDTVGNVFEWCSDWYADSPSGNVNPRGPESGEKRSMRGSHYGAYPKHLRCAYRGWAPPENKQDNIGFRCARDVE